MGFLDNSGDILVDATLTDTGRYRLAKGDGSFKIVKFACADDEIDYGLFDSAHASGSAYYDLQLLLTPVFEAFTDNAASMKHKLLSLPKTNLLYLPVLRLNEILDGNRMPTTAGLPSSGTFNVAVDADTEAYFQNTIARYTGLLYGENPSSGGTTIRVDQGLDTIEIPRTHPLDSDLIETQYIIEIDSRFGQIVTSRGATTTVSYIDDDQIASYFLSTKSDSSFVELLPVETSTRNANTTAIAGPRGSSLQFKIKSSEELNSSTYLFSQLGFVAQVSPEVLAIDSYIRITGATTGVNIDVPVRFLKYNA